MKNMPHTTTPNESIRRKTSFACDVSKLVSGTVVAQGLQILISPLLTRLYGPAAFGVMTLFTSITGILGVIACMRYELSIMLPDNDREAVNLFAVSLFFSLITSLLTVPILLICKHPILRWLNAPELGPYLWLVPVAVFVNGVFLALNYWNSRTKHFGRLSIASVSNSLAAASSFLGLGYAGYATGGTMIGGVVAGQVVATTVLGGQIWRDNGKFFRLSIRWREMLAGIQRHRKFPLYSTWSAFFNNASWQLPAIMLAMFFSPSIVGFYALGFRILKLPMNLVGRAVSQVFFQRAAAAKANGALSPLVEGLLSRLILVGIFPILMLTIIGKDLFALVFGELWAEAGVYAQILSIWAYIWFISSPLTTLFCVLEKQEFGLKWSVVLFVTRIVALGVGGLCGNARIALFMFAISGIGLYGYLNYRIAKFAGVEIRNLLCIIVKAFALFSPFGFCIAMLRHFGINVWGLLGAVGISAAIYAWAVLRIAPNFAMVSKKTS